MFIPLSQTMMYTCLNLIVVKNVIFNTSKAAKKDGIKDGDQMKLTTQRLKKLIRESMDNMDKLKKMVASGEEGRNMAIELVAAKPEMGISKEEVEKMDAPWAFELPYGQRPAWALRQEMNRFHEMLQNTTDETQRREIEDYIEGLKEELYDY